MLQIVCPIAGQANRFQQRGYTFPKPLIEIAGRSLIEIVLSSLDVPADHRYVFICRKEHLSQYFLDDVLRLLCGECEVFASPGETDGALCTALLAIDHIDPDEELLIVNGDQYIAESVAPFYERCRGDGVDGCILTFTAAHPRWSFVRTAKDDSGRVMEVAEKRPISRQATAGLYYFRRAGDFFDAAERMVLKGIRTAGQFFICPVYNEMILEGKSIVCHHLSDGAMFSLGTPEDVDTFTAHLNDGRIHLPQLKQSAA